MKRALLILVVAGLSTVLLSAWAARAYMHRPAAQLSVPLAFEVEEGASLARVARQLQAAGVLERPRLFTLWARVGGMAARIKAGEYELVPGSSPAAILEQLVAGRIKLYPFTIVEGWTVRDVAAAVAASDVLEVMLDYGSATELAAELDLDAAHAEGQFFPDTYLVPRGTSDRDLLLTAAAALRAKLAAAWESRSADVPLANPYELLVLASIVERETALDSERPEVAGVFVRRLQKGMRLQTDPTVIYGLGDSFDGDLRRRDLTTDTPYNTYTRGGLPPTPIAMPGAASLRAAAQPADGDTLYFVATGDPDGSHVFSATLDEHNAAVAAYIARLRQINRTRPPGTQAADSASK